jgi:TRAP transporter TAXI family solute receptor
MMSAVPRKSSGVGVQARWGRPWSGVLFAAALVCGCASPVPQPPQVLTLTMHPDQSVRIGDMLRQALGRRLQGWRIEIRDELRQLEMMAALQDSEADVAFAYADSAYLAHVGTFDNRRFDRLRAIATLNMSPVYILVRGDSNIDDIDDLKERRVNVGQPGTRTALTVEAILNTFGHDVRKSQEPFREALARLENGTLDAAFAVGGYDPILSLEKSVRSGRVRLLSISKSALNSLRRDHPFVHGLVLAPGLYDDRAVLTFGIERLLLCREGLDREVVYQLTRAFFEALPDLSSADSQLRQMSVEGAPATAVPLHEGAARYYREQEQM